MFERFIRFASGVAMLVAGSACSEPGQREVAENQSSVQTGSATVAKTAERPKELEQLIAQRRKACGGKVGANFGETTTADFNADGKTDYALSQENFLCADEPGGQMTWGTGGPQHEFLVSTANGYVLDEGFAARYGISIAKRPTGDVVLTDYSDTSAEGCGETVTTTWSWTGKKMEPTDRRNAKGQKVDVRGCVASASGSLPIKLGYYGYADDGCAVAMRSNTGGITISDKYWGDIDGDYPIRPVKNLGDGKYRLGDAADMIRVTGSNSFVADEGTEFERRFIWCAAKAPK